MAVRKRSRKLVLPDVTEEVKTPEAIRLAFAKRLPRIPPADLTKRPKLPSDDEWAAKETFTLFVRASWVALFPDVPAEIPRTFLEWSPRQQALLLELAKLSAEVLINAGDLSEKILRVGAMTMEPGDERYLIRYVGLLAPGPLEREIEGRPVWLWLRLHLMGRVTREAWLQASAGIDDGARLELARLSVNNAYQLLRRWPFPDRITPQQEQEDTSSLFEGVLPVLAVLGERTLRDALVAEVGRPHPNGALVVLISIVLLERNLQLLDAERGELAEACDAALIAAVSLYATHGRRLLLALSPERRASLVRRMEPVSHNARGFWTYADLLGDAERGTLVTAALAGFQRACRDDVAARVKELVRGLGPEQRRALRAVATGKGPNAGLLADALAQLD